MELPAPFLTLAKLYESQGKKLYLVGGTSRDLLLGLPVRDLDFVTDATPEEEKNFLPDADYTFARFGSIKVKVDGITCDVTTFRAESSYLDSRHPSKIVFISSMEEDSKRRDFTVNALYISAKGEVFDFHKGQEDLQNKILRFIGNPYQRIQEDPLRILRGERFARRLGFTIEPASRKAMDDLRGELAKLNQDKVSMEEKKE